MRRADHVTVTLDAVAERTATGARTAGRASARTAGRTTAPARHIDVSLVAAVLAVVGLGLLMVYSATFQRLENQGLDPQALVRRQGIASLVGVGAMIAMTLVDYRRFRTWMGAIYLATVVGLVLVLTPLGAESKGAQAWFDLGGFQVQPSELAKVSLVLCLAAYASIQRGAMKARHVVVVLALAAVPMALIYLQPDLGTALVFVAILMAMMLVAGARGRHIAVLMLLGGLAVVAVLRLGVLEQYQLDRLGAFLNPNEDARGSAYNLRQAQIAISAGGATGKGLFQGTQTSLSYVPEQHTDFIFTVVGEELGMVGAASLLALYALIVWRVWRAATVSRDLFGALVCCGVLAMLVAQVFENVGMAMGIMPITGIPLPFMSYGGSSVVASFAAIGLVLNVHMRRFR